MRGMLVVLAAGLLSAGGLGCGGNGTSSPSGSAPPPGARALVQIASAGCSASASSSAGAGSRTGGSCTFVLSDGRRFRCPSAFGQRSTLSATDLEHAKACMQVARLVIPASSRAVFATISTARTCLIRQGLRVTGGPVLPSQGPHSPDGELVVVDGTAPVFIAFYSNSRKALRLEPAAIQNVRRFGGEAVRRGAVTVVWTRRPTPDVRSSIEGCAFG